MTSAAITFAFEPDARRARMLDRRMHSQLAASLRYLQQQVCTQLRHHKALCRAITALDKVITGIENDGIYPPSCFGLYYKVTDALMGESPDKAIALIQELAREAPVLRSLSFLSLAQVQPQRHISLYQTLMDTDPQSPFCIISPPADQERGAIERVESAWRRLQLLLPELAGEFARIIRQVIVVEGDTSQGNSFAGGSCYMLWGALFINASYPVSELAMIETLAHESAHSLLFGLTIDEPLVLNPDDQLLNSPLRDDPRPVDGIYHATYVTARMHWAMKASIASGGLSDNEILEAKKALTRNHEAFFSGYHTLEEYAEMTATGEQLMRSALQYMQGQAGN